MNPVGSVSHLFRYPVKSLRGESLDQAAVETRGLVGDRLWALRDEVGKLASGKSTRRFRPNLLIDIPDIEGLVEDSWVGREVQVGDVLLRVVQSMPRCEMTTHAQGSHLPLDGDRLPLDKRVLRTITEINDANFGVLAEVIRPGRIHVGA